MGEVRKRNATEQQKDFVHHLVAGRVTATEAARLAGYGSPKQAAYVLTRNPAVSLLLRQERQTLYQGELASLSADTLKQVMIDPDAPASAKVSAARTALELAGDLGPNAKDNASGRSLAEMTPEELSSMIDQWEGDRAALAKDVTAQSAAQK